MNIYHNMTDKNTSHSIWTRSICNWLYKMNLCSTHNMNVVCAMMNNISYIGLQYRADTHIKCYMYPFYCIYLYICIQKASSSSTKCGVSLSNIFTPEVRVKSSIRCSLWCNTAACTDKHQFIYIGIYVYMYVYIIYMALRTEEGSNFDLARTCE